MILRLQRSVLKLFAVCLLVTAPLAPARAAIVGTDAAIAMSQRADTVARVSSVLMRDDVRHRLESLGVDPQQALERVSALTDGELATMEARLDELPAGGSLLGVIGAVLVVLIILEILGVTNVFTAI